MDGSSKIRMLVLSMLGILILLALIALFGLYALMYFDNQTISFPTMGQRAPGGSQPRTAQPSNAQPRAPVSGVAPATPVLGTPRPTLTPSPTWPPPPTNTLVIQPGEVLPPLFVVPRTPTRSPNPYAIFIPTPTASVLNMAIAFSSTLQIVTYNVAGKTVNEISNSLEANALADPHEPNSRYYARTDWYLNRQWTTQITARGCELERGNVTINITMTLPVLTNAATAPPDVLNRWNTFLDNTVAHESEHVRINMNGARELQREIANLPPAAACDTLNTQITAIAKARFQALDRAGVEFDQKTNHGLATGAIFP